MAKKFSVPSSETAKPTSPENVFPTFLRGPRDPSVKHLWVHQGDILRAYEAVKSHPDIALELPTGAGKSLVGLLIAEYRRQSHDERVVCLCPTRQLARQLQRQATTYGIPAIVLVGKQNEYPAEDFSAYNRGEKIAVTTYSGVFNINPRINNASCLLLDDAHAAEKYVADLWSVRIDREKHRATYDAIVDLFAEVIPDGLLLQLIDDDAFDDGAVGIVPQSALWNRSSKLREVIAAGAAQFVDKKHRPKDAFDYSWSRVNESLDACNVYLSKREILVRPLCPPTETHAAFAHAKQRIYMSATLGHGGDLERALGVRKITRLPLPQGWDKKATGRRLFLLPGVSLEDDASEELATKFATRFDRILVLTTDSRRQAHIEGGWLKKAGKKILHADDVEDDLSAFITASNAALVLTNRYDGIDLPDEACRALVIDSLPNATNLQERFLTQRLGAHAILRERIRTRITQAMGRCTRNDADHATVLILGSKLNQFLEQRDVRASMHPEVQAELKVALNNSIDNSVDDYMDLAALFKTSGWDDFEKYILQERQTLQRADDPIASPLQKFVKSEIEYVYASWHGDWRFAAEAAQRVADGLEGGAELKPYRALWYYLASNAIRRARVQPEAADVVADNLIERAAQCAPGLNSFLRIAQSTAQASSPKTSEVDVVACGNAAAVLATLGSTGTKFERRMNAIRDALAGIFSKPYEGALDWVGELLGFKVLPKLPAGKAVPDSIWTLDGFIVIGWEAKNEERPEHPIGIGDMRQANGHFDYMQHRLKIKSIDNVFVVLASPRSTIDKDSVAFTNRLHYASMADVVALGEDLARALGRARTAAGGAGEAALAEAVLTEFRQAKLLPDDLLARFKKLSDVPVLRPRPKAPGGTQTPPAAPGTPPTAPAAPGTPPTAPAAPETPSRT
ncbi:unnamed protein product [Sorangium cellulosum So ce56]|uniref:Sorangium cellulosum 'So ce 56' complete genome n=1 Tax=Sorangium cellulosum (strain So ce56) TaxID=448385 RepID=A9GTT8_SORC5|nr:DEAD/DEAH box helicase [Sorangium cellulosum]CAN96993.1 unnamed protein product [Sorangium cellulosum So ce56]